MIYFIHMLPEKPDIIDINRRKFIKASLVLAGGFVLGKVSGLLSLASAISAPSRTSSVRVKEYKNTRYGFSLLHPNDLKVSTFDEGGGASTITFQNVEKAEGFQIFVTPYSEPHVGEVPYNGTQVIERLTQVPSGVHESTTPIAVGGAAGVSFYTTTAALGATREVRVVHNGFLYELTTPKPLDIWLGAIIPTWKFA